MLVLNLITAFLGPTAIGFISAIVFADDMQLGSAIALVNCVSVPLAALVLWTGLKPFRAAVAERSAAG
jgi:hypothetical protein